MLDQKNDPMTRFLDALVLLALMLYILAGSPPFHGDESTLTHTTRDYYYQFIARDFSMIAFNGASDPMDQNLRLIDGRVQKIVGGFLWHIGGFTVKDLNRPWLWGADWEYNLANGHIPSDALLQTQRFASAALMALGVIPLFFIAYRLNGRGAAYAACLLYATNPALLLNGRRAMMEGALVLFSLLTVLAAMWFLEQQRAGARRRVAASVLVLGLSAGMALASKHTAVLVLVPVFAACAGVLLHRRDPWRLGGLAAAGLASLLIFFILNPAWWNNPTGAGAETLRVRAETLATQRLYFDSYDSLAEQVAGVWRQVIVGAPQYYEADDWADFIAEQIAAYETSPWQGIRLGVLALPLLLAGFARLSRMREPVTLAWGTVTPLLVVLVTPLEWQRYYLPAILPLCLVMGVGLWYIYSRIFVRK